jgi:D-amino-acid dehydrogenase
VRRTRELSAELGLRYDAAAAGALKIFGDAQALAGPLGMANMLARQGLRFQVLQRDEVIAMEPQLAPAAGRIGCAIYFPDDMSGDACAFTRALADQARLAGATIRASALVERILVEAGRVRGVVVRGERIAADQVVVAAGCASPRLVAPLGVPLSIAPVKGYTVTVDLRHVAARPRIPIVDDAMHAALTPLGDRMRVAGTAEFSGNDVALSPHRIANLFRLLERIYPQLAQQVDRRTAFAWTGLRPMSADGLPFIGAAGPQGLWINSGHGHLGWTLAVGSAALLASLMREEAPSVEPGPYRVRR